MVIFETLSDQSKPPLEIPAAIGGHSGPPSAVLEAIGSLPPASLVCWNDDHSKTIGIGRSSRVIAMPRQSLVRVSIDIMHPAKGRGWVALEATVKGQHSPMPLLRSLVYTTEALNWLLSRKSTIESVFGLLIEVNDHGCDY